MAKEGGRVGRAGGGSGSNAEERNVWAVAECLRWWCPPCARPYELDTSHSRQQASAQLTKAIKDGTDWVMHAYSVFAITTATHTQNDLGHVSQDIE